MDNQEKYKQKYLKYKDKYLKLRSSMRGGGNKKISPDELRKIINRLYDTVATNLTYRDGSIDLKNTRVLWDIAIDIPIPESIDIPVDGLKCTSEDCKKHNKLIKILKEYKNSVNHKMDNIDEGIVRLEKIHELCKCSSFLDFFRGGNESTTEEVMKAVDVVLNYKLPASTDAGGLLHEEQAWKNTYCKREDCVEDNKFLNLFNKTLNELKNSSTFQNLSDAEKTNTSTNIMRIESAIVKLKQKHERCGCQDWLDYIFKK